MRSKFSFLFVGIQFDESKCEFILKNRSITESVYTKGHLFFWQAKTKFWNLQSNSHSCYYNEIQKFESCAHMAICFFTTKYKILKVVPKQPLVFPEGNTKSDYLLLVNLVLRLKIEKEFENMISRYFVSFFYNKKRN